MTLLSLLIAVLILCLLCWIVSLIPLPPKSPPFIKPVLYIFIALICIAFLLDLGGFADLGLHRRIR